MSEGEDDVLAKGKRIRIVLDGMTGQQRLEESEWCSFRNSCAEDAGRRGASSSQYGHCCRVRAENKCSGVSLKQLRLLS